MVEAGLEGAMIEEELKQFLLVLCVSLSVATLPQIFSWLRKIPYTLMLVIVGTGLAVLDVRLVTLSPGLILTIFLPPLLFEASWNCHWSKLKQYLVPIGLYASLGVVLSVVGIAAGLVQFAGFSIATALLVGACLSATDPVSVMALFKELGVGKKLATVMEGESLFNDGTAIVAFSFLLAFALGQSTLAPQPIIQQFLLVVGIGLGVGLVIGFAISYLTQRFDLPLVEQSLTLVSAYGAYLLSEQFGGSGVIATVVTGVILGNFGSRIGMNPRTRALVGEFWDFIAFFVNSIVFLLIGNQIQLQTLIDNRVAIALTIAGMTLSRCLSIYVLGFLSNQVISSRTTVPEQTVLWWGGLRGAISVALALSVPTYFPDRPQIIAIVFGAVLFTLLVQGLTIQPLLVKLNLLGNQSMQEEYKEAIARRVALNRALLHLQAAENRPGIDTDFYAYQTSLVKGELTSVEQRIEQLISEYPQLQEFAQVQLQTELQAIEAETYAELLQIGQLNQVLAPLLGETEQVEA